MPIITRRLWLAVLLCLTTTVATAEETPTMTIDQTLLILSSASPQTQGMAMVLGNTLASQGTRVRVLLCDHAGDLALANPPATVLAPKQVTPAQLLRRLQQQGAEVQVCALYLPNSEHGEEDLAEGVTVATPPAMASLMRDARVRVFTF